MGITNMKLTVKNPSDPTKSFTGNFLVDSGATHSVVPDYVLRSIGVDPIDEDYINLADGTFITRKIGNVLYEYEGRQRSAPVIFGEKGDSRLMGAITLEALGYVINPLKQTIQKALLRM